MLSILLAINEIENEDERALVQRLFFDYGRQVKALAQSILHSEHDAEDALHDTFLKIIKYREKFAQIDGDETKRLIVIYTRSVCFNLYRRKKRENGFAAETGDADDGMSAADREADDVDVLESVLARESAERLKRAIDALASPAREIVLLKYYGEMTNFEISDLLGINASTVGSILHRSLQKIKAKMEAYLCDTE